MAIKVLIVDDSQFIRSVFKDILSSDPDINVVGTACDAYDARTKIKELNPDVITLDIEMPNMDGISFLEKIMTLRPMPVVMVSTLTQKGADSTIKALELGAVDCIGKPSDHHNENSLKNLREVLIEKIKIAAKANIRILKNNIKPNIINEYNNKLKSSNKIIAIGSSTGGVEALKEIITKLPKYCPPVLIVQHMPEGFTASFAKRLDGLSEVKVMEAQNNMLISQGNVYIAPGGKQMKIKKEASKLVLQLTNDPLMSSHRPSVDYLYNSLVENNLCERVIGVILTGMGKDGASNMLKMKQFGSFNIGQNEASCVVYGMPKAAKENGALDLEITLDKIAKAILSNC